MPTDPGHSVLAVPIGQRQQVTEPFAAGITRRPEHDLMVPTVLAEQQVVGDQDLRQEHLGRGVAGRVVGVARVDSPMISSVRSTT